MAVRTATPLISVMPCSRGPEREPNGNGVTSGMAGSPWRWFAVPERLPVFSQVVFRLCCAATASGIGHAGMGPQVDFRVFDAPPEALNEDLVAPSVFSVHAVPDLTSGQHLDDVGRGELP